MYESLSLTSIQVLNLLCVRIQEVFGGFLFGTVSAAIASPTYDVRFFQTAHF